MDHYGLRNSGSIDHVEHVPVQVTIFAWYTVFSAWLRKPSGTTNSWRPGSLTSWPNACNKESNAFFGVSCQDGISWPITFFVSVGITFMAWGAGGGGVCDANKAMLPKWKPCRDKCNNLFKRLPGDNTATDIKLIWGHVGLMLGPLLGHVGPGLGYLEAMSGNFWAKDFAQKKNNV